MKLRRLSMANARSFLEPTTLFVEGDISIVVGPNGGGKTNLLDIGAYVLRKHLIRTYRLQPGATAEYPDRMNVGSNQNLDNLVIQPHSEGGALPKIVEIDLEVTDQDISNIREISPSIERLAELAAKKYNGWAPVRKQVWDQIDLRPNRLLSYKIQNDAFVDVGPEEQSFLAYLQGFDMISKLRDELRLAPLSMPMLYLPITRLGQAFSQSVTLSNFNPHDELIGLHAASSKSGGGIGSLPVGSLASRYLQYVHDSNPDPKNALRSEPDVNKLTRTLSDLGYQWDLVLKDMPKNQFDVVLTKQGKKFSLGAASSGEKELLLYVFAIYGLKIKDALILVDEPELHLHPKWQSLLLQLFVHLAKETGNQFVLATHSPKFISPNTIQYVSRVYMDDSQSRIVRLNESDLPSTRHLFQIVNSQNNERIFFCDFVILVEGIGDRLFFEAILGRFSENGMSIGQTYEVVDVGGKGFFDAYSKVLKACKIPFSIVADRDYVEQIGDESIKRLFEVDDSEIKQDVLLNNGSLDGKVLVEAIDSAIATGDWTIAGEVWEYIKRRRLRLRADLSAEDSGRLVSFLAEKEGERIFILRKGALEDYLPRGLRSKDLNKLIAFLDKDQFWEALDGDDQTYLSGMANLLLATR